MADDDVESEHERLNRNLEQLLQELRVALPGVHVLFALLTAVPVAGLSTLGFAFLWYALPLSRRVRGKHSNLD